MNNTQNLTPWIKDQSDHPNGRHSSIRAYFYDDVPKWLNKTHIADKYGSAVEYLDFMNA